VSLGVEVERKVGWCEFGCGSQKEGGDVTFLLIQLSQREIPPFGDENKFTKQGNSLQNISIFLTTGTTGSIFHHIRDFCLSNAPRCDMLPTGAKVVETN
jgi:hypothetical protein